MNFQNNKYALELANETDNEGIYDVFDAGHFDGGLSVKYMRSHKPLSSFKADGEDIKILIIRDLEHHRIIAVGGAVIRKEYINGEVKKCGYLTGLKIHPEYQKKIRFIPEAYRFLRENTSDCDFFYTTILDDNKNTIKLLEKGHRNMPKYHYLGHYTTFCFHGGKNLLELEENNLSGFETLLKTHFRSYSFTPVDYNLKGFGEKTFYSIRNGDEILACCFVGNQQETKQYYMNAYGGIYRFISRLPTQWFGYPKFPKQNSNIHYGTVSYLYVKNNDKRLCSDFLRTVAKKSGFSLLLWGCLDTHPLYQALTHMKTVPYGSRLYTVTWENTPQVSADLSRIGVEVALL